MIHLLEFNPYHGKDGKFSSKNGAGGGGAAWTAPSGRTVAEVSPKRFLAALRRAKRTNPHADFVSDQTAAHLREIGAKVYITPGGHAGYYMGSNGYVGGLFSDGKQKGVGRDLLLHAVEHGATKLDCYSGEGGKRGFLDSLYAEFGFKEVARYPFNAEFVPPSWNYARDGRPDYVDMEWAGGDRRTVRDRMEKGKDLKESAEADAEAPEKPYWADEDNMCQPHRPVSWRRDNRWPTDLEMAREKLVRGGKT